MAKYALYVSLKAKPGKEKDVEAFLKQGAEMAKKEAGTVNWYGLKEGEGSYSVFDTFNDEAGTGRSPERRDCEGADGEGERVVCRSAADPQDRLFWRTSSLRRLFGVLRCGLYVAEDAKEVAAEEFFHVLGGVASGHECGGDFGEVGGGVDAFGRDGDAVEVGADADVVDAGDFDDVVEVIDE